MKSWDEYYKPGIPPVAKISWFGYKDGKVFGPFAKRPTQYKLVEKIVENKKEIEEFKKNEEKIYSNAVKEWKNDLCSMYNYIPKEILYLCYQKAYDEGHSSGFDEIENCMSDIVYFANSIIEKYKNGSK